MQTVLRVTMIYFFLFIGLRIMGKREFGQLSPSELISLLLIPELVSQSVLQEDFSLINAIIAVTTLLSLVFLTSLISHLKPKVQKFISGEPSILVAHGTLIEKSLNKERVSPEEIFSEMHKAGLYRLDQVRWAILESDGRIALIPAADDTIQSPSADEKRAT